MPKLSPTSQDITTINYTLSWPHLENPSNTTFAGPTQIDICRCGSSSGQNLTDLGHIYTRYRCPRPKIHFASSEDDLWVFQVPLGQVNLLRPANGEEIELRKQITATAEPMAYAGKNFLLLTGPCPRGRYQAYATLQFLRSLSSPARQHIECLSLLIQHYEEDCSDDQGGRAYVELARYILEELPAFKTLCLNIWSEETRLSTREFAMVLWREGVRVVVSWDWWSGETEEYTDVETFLRGIEEGVVANRPVWETAGEEDFSEYGRREDGTMIENTQFNQVGRPRRTLASYSSSRETFMQRGPERSEIVWDELSESESEDGDDDTVDDNESGYGEENRGVSDYDWLVEDAAGDEANFSEGQDEEEEELESDRMTSAHEYMSDGEEWSDGMFTPLSPHDVLGDQDGRR